MYEERLDPHGLLSAKMYVPTDIVKTITSLMALPECSQFFETLVKEHGAPGSSVL